MTARIGFIIPSSNRMVEGEMVLHVPPGVVAHVARLRMTGAHRVTIHTLMPRVAEAVGFGDAENMRRAFIRVYGQPPQSIRRAIRG